MKSSLQHKIINTNTIKIHAKVESEIISSDSIFVFIHPLIFKVKNKKILPKLVLNGTAHFDIDFQFVGKNKVIVYEDNRLAKEYVYESNNADEFC